VPELRRLGVEANPHSPGPAGPLRSLDRKGKFLSVMRLVIAGLTHVGVRADGGRVKLAVTTLDQWLDPTLP